MVRKSNIVSVGVRGGIPPITTTPCPVPHLLRSQTWSFQMKSHLPPLPAPSGLPLLHISGCTLERKVHRRTRKERTVRPPNPKLARVTGMCNILMDRNMKLRCIFSGKTFDFLLVLFWPVKIHGSCISIQRVNGVGISQQLRQERLKNVGQIWGSRDKKIIVPINTNYI